MMRATKFAIAGSLILALGVTLSAIVVGCGGSNYGHMSESSTVHAPAGEGGVTADADGRVGGEAGEVRFDPSVAIAEEAFRQAAEEDDYESSFQTRREPGIDFRTKYLERKRDVEINAQDERSKLSQGQVNFANSVTPDSGLIGTVSVDANGNVVNAPVRPRASRPAFPASRDSIKVIARLDPDEELWVISKSSDVDAERERRVGAEDAVPGAGALMCIRPSIETPVAAPLKHTEVSASMSGYISAVNVQQQYENPFDVKIEAVYVFPLPQNAAVSEFVMTVGDRKIRGVVRERKEAERIYEAAKSQGHHASLLTQERANIFTQKVANIEPKKSIDIDITYFNTLAYARGGYEFVFPMVVGPRFNPAGSADPVIASPRGGHPAPAGSTQVQYLRPAERTGHDIGLTLNIDAGVEIEHIHSPSHAIETETIDSTRAVVKLSRLDSIPNKDFVLRYRVAGERVKTALMTHRDERGGFFTLLAYPPAELESLERAPMEMIFVLDCSGSMNGAPIKKAKTAISRAMKKLRPDDTFQIIRFSNNASQLGPSPVLATAQNVERGLSYLDGLSGSGGTMMIEGIRAALDFPHDERRLRFVCFMTDGYIGNEAQILGAVHEKLGESRIFSFGVGSSPNRFLMNRMAKLGMGAVAYVGLNDNAGEVMDLFFDRISHPALSNLYVDWGSMEVTDVYPRRTPDLFVDRPIMLTGRFNGNEPTTIRLRGRAGGEFRDVLIEVDPRECEGRHKGIPNVWARTKIADLADEATYAMSVDPAEAARIPMAIEQTALQFGLVSAYTAFVAVDSLSQTEGAYGVSVQQPVHVPEGVKYSTTVGR